MPNLFHVGGYSVYFWTNEGVPIEPVHVHVSQGKPSASGTKIWLSQNGQGIVCNNNSDIPSNILSRIVKTIEANREYIEAEWQSVFGEISYYC